MGKKNMGYFLLGAGAVRFWWESNSWPASWKTNATMNSAMGTADFGGRFVTLAMIAVGGYLAYKG